MQGTFFLAGSWWIEGPMSWSKVLEQYFNGQIHDETRVWHSLHRCWYRFAELKLIVVTKRERHTSWCDGWEDSDG